MTELLNVEIHAPLGEQFQINKICDEVFNQFNENGFNLVFDEKAFGHIKKCVVIKEQNCFDIDLDNECTPLPIEFSAGIRLAAALELPLVIEGRTKTICWAENIAQIKLAARNGSMRQMAIQLENQFRSHSYD